MADFRISIEEKTLNFLQPAGTSRGVYTTRTSWFVTITSTDDPEHFGIGECAPLPDLSCDASPDYRDRLEVLCRATEKRGCLPRDLMADKPSMAFGLETAWQHYISRSWTLFDTPFSRGEVSIPINGLVWMGRYDEMLKRMETKLSDGYRCVKLKIGAIDFDKEIDLLRIIREAFPADKVQIRVDANGAFTPDVALSRLETIAGYDVHSIEQPIRQGQWKQMSDITADSPLPIALDEELIGLHTTADCERMLDSIHPHFIVVKPSLHGGMEGTREWIDLARRCNIGSWITSALESNIGLNAIAQLTSDIYGPEIDMAQGLGTGQLFSDNIKLPHRLDVDHGFMRILK